MPPDPRVHHEFRHPGFRVAREVEVADDLVGLGDQQMAGAVVREFAQHLFADRGHAIEFRCRRGEFAHLPLLVRGERRAPGGRGH